MKRKIDTAGLASQLAEIDLEQFKRKAHEYLSGGLKSQSLTPRVNASAEPKVAEFDRTDRAMLSLPMRLEAQLREIEKLIDKSTAIYRQLILEHQPVPARCEACRHVSVDGRLRKGLCFACYRRRPKITST